MSTLGKVLLVFVFLATVGFLYVSARAMKTLDVHRTWHKTYEKAKDERDQAIKEPTGQAKDESPEKANLADGVRQLSRLHDRLVESQGRVWRDCALTNRNANVLTIQVGEANAKGITDKSVLYLFEQHPQPQPPAAFNAAAYED